MKVSKYYFLLRRNIGTLRKNHSLPSEHLMHAMFVLLITDSGSSVSVTLSGNWAVWLTYTDNCLAIISLYDAVSGNWAARVA